MELKGDLCVYHEACCGTSVCAREPLGEGRAAGRNQASSSHEEVTRKGMHRHSARWPATRDGSARWLSLEGCLLLSKRVPSGVRPSCLPAAPKQDHSHCQTTQAGLPRPQAHFVGSSSSAKLQTLQCHIVNLFEVLLASRSLFCDSPMRGSCEQWPSQATNA